MKLGTCLYNFIWSHSLVDAIRHVAELGFKAVEIMATPPHLDPRAFDHARRDQVRAALAETGVTVVSVNPTFGDINLASRNPTFRRASINEIKACVDVAHVLEASIVVVGPGRRHPLALEPIELMDSLAHPAIRECVDYASAKGVTCGLENITGAYLARSDEIADFIDDLDNPYCRAVLDVANASLYEDPVQAVRTLGHRICHVHLSDTDGHSRAHWPIGMGAVDFTGVARALDEVGYAGWCLLETTWMQNPDQAVTTSLRALRALGWST